MSQLFTPPSTRAPLFVLALACAAGWPDVSASPPAPAPAVGRYTLDPAHTFPSFEADHWGLSVWRGKFNRSRGIVVLDRAHATGTLDVIIDMTSVDFGLDAMNQKAAEPDLLDTTRFPEATYKGTLAGFVDGKPTRVEGQLTLHGVTRPLQLRIHKFACRPDPMVNRERCGADASANFFREDFGISAGKDYGFDMGVGLEIQVEAVRDE